MFCVFRRPVQVYEADEADEVDGPGFMMITLSEGVQNQSNPRPNAFLPSTPAISKVSIDYSSRSCLLGGAVERDCLRNGKMIMHHRL